MAEQNVILRVLADVAGANASFAKMQKALSSLSNGALTLGKNFNVFQKGVQGSIGAQQAADAVAKQYLATMRTRLSLSKAEAAGIQALTVLHKAEAASMQAKLAVMKAEAAADDLALKQMQQELALRKLAVQEIELENRERRALAATKTSSVAATKSSTAATEQNTVAAQSNAHANGSASFALLSLGQAFQDSAQFGMGFAQGLRAINNNVQQVFTAIALGSVQAGGFSALMRSMAASMWGPGGLIIGFSILSATLEFFATRSQKAAAQTKKLNEEAAEFVRIAREAVAVSRDSDVPSLDIDPQRAAAAVVRVTARIAELQAIIKRFDQQGIQNLGILDAQRYTNAANEIQKLTSAYELLSPALAAYQRILFAEQELRAAGLGDLVDEIKARERLERRLDALAKKAKDAYISGIEIAPLEFVDLLSLDPRDPAATVISNRFKEIARSATLVGQLGDFQGVGGGEIQQMSDATLSEMDRLGAEIEARNRAGTDSWAAHWLARTEATMRSAEIMSQAIGGIGTSFMQIAQAGDSSNKRLFETGKKFAIAQALISTYVGFTKALEQGGPLGIATGAAVIAAGMAKVAAIRATTMNGRGGGSGSGGGGLSGISSAPSFFTGFTNTNQIPASSPGFPVVPLGQRSQQQVNFVIDGRNLVGVLENNSAAQQRMTGRSMVVGTASSSDNGGFVDLTLER